MENGFGFCYYLIIHHWGTSLSRYCKKFWFFLTFKVLLILDLPVSHSFLFKTKLWVLFWCPFSNLLVTIFLYMVSYFLFDIFHPNLSFCSHFLLFLKTFQYSCSWKYRGRGRALDEDIQGATILFIICRFSKVSLLYRRLRLACSLFFQNGFLKEHMNKISTYTKKVNPCNRHLKIRKHNRKEKYKEIMFNQIFFFLKRKNQIITKH